jgi:DNA-binding PucR family transcriptional regulator
VAFVPDPDAPGRHAQLRAALGDTPAALGPTVPLERAARSLARAQAAHILRHRGVLGDEALVVADDHLPALLLHGDGPLGADLAARALAPLEALKPAARERLAETLRAWLDAPGQIQRIAGRLHVHPQTVRYRVAQLRDLFGEGLDDPETRFELALAVRLAGETVPYDAA